MLLSPDEIQKIEAQVAESESKTTGEIVILLVNASLSPRIWNYRGITLGVLLTSLLLGLWAEFGKYPGYSLSEILMFQTLGGLFGFLIAQKFLPSKNLCRKSALGYFKNAGLQETDQRTAVLIYISLRERFIQILGDKGINEKVPPNYWQTQVEGLIHGLKEKALGEALIRCVQDMGHKLETHFPKSAQNPNEISDSIRIMPTPTL